MSNANISRPAVKHSHVLTVTPLAGRTRAWSPWPASMTPAMSTAAKTPKPRAADVARWVATLAAPAPTQGIRAIRDGYRARSHARGQLASWGLDAQGNVKPAAASLCPCGERLREAGAACCLECCADVQERGR